MTLRLTPLVLAATLALSSLTAAETTPVQTERIEASYVLAFGRAPSPAEIAKAGELGAIDLADLIARHRQQLEADAALKRVTAVKAWKDAFGREPTDKEIASSVSGNATYTELMKRHIQSLAANAAEYEKVMERAYRLVIRRGVYAEEIAYWKKYDTLPYALLVGAIEDWGRRNAPGLMVTTGTPTVSINSNYLTTIRLSPTVATEARAAAGLAVPGTADFIAASGRNLIAAGAGNLVTGGRMHFAATGGSNLVSDTAVN
ncbi:MAG TPA: hypothetical protein VL069_12625 [Opitutus sp.]|nr:hypothetical protein [Opitutus sp.]